MKIGISLDIKDVKQAFAVAPKTMERSLDRFLSRAAEEVAREAKIAAPKDLSALTNSIRSTQPGLLRYMVAPGVAYARAVEEGTKPGYFPNFRALMDWLNVPSRRGFRLAKPGSSKRTSQAEDLRERAMALGRYIQEHGTKPRPYMEPTAKKMESRVMALVRQGAINGVMEVFG